MSGPPRGDGRPGRGPGRLLVAAVLVVVAVVVVVVAVRAGRTGPSVAVAPSTGPSDVAAASAAASVAAPTGEPTAGAPTAQATGASEGVSARPTPAPGPSPSAAPEPTPRPTPTPRRPVTLAFGGDVHFEGVVRSALDAEGPDALLADIAPVLRAADVAVVNLETAITDGGTPDPKEFTFRGPPSGLDALVAAGVDAVSLANNHGVDYGIDGLLDTLTAARERGLPVLGAGRDAQEAYAPWRTRVAGWRLAFIGATQVLDSYAIEAWTARDDRPGLASAKENGIDRLLTTVRRAARTADGVVVMLHWGAEGEFCPLPRQRELAAALADAGADVIVGGHAHRVQSAGYLGDAVVAYGLGNFVFYTGSGPGTETGVLEVTLHPEGPPDLAWRPATLVGGRPRPLEGDAAASAVASWDERRGCTDLSATPAGR